MGLASFNRMRKLRAEQEAAKGQSVAEAVEQSKLSELTVQELKDLAKQKGLTGYSKMKEAELIALIESSDAQ